MYLEISPRQSGKTTRLAKFAVKKALSGKRVVVMLTSQQSVVRFIELLHTIEDAYLCGSKIYTVTYDNYGRHLKYGSAFDWYLFDEFDYACDPSIDRTYIKKNGYYSTTPRFIRDAKYRRTYNAKRKQNCIAFDLMLELTRKRKRTPHYFPAVQPSRHLNISEAHGVWKMDTIPVKEVVLDDV